jgi:hypothetical protein
VAESAFFESGLQFLDLPEDCGRLVLAAELL